MSDEALQHLRDTLRELGQMRFNVYLSEQQLDDAFRWARVLLDYTGVPMLPEIPVVAIAMAMHRPWEWVLKETTREPGD